MKREERGERGGRKREGREIVALNGRAGLKGKNTEAQRSQRGV